MWVFFYTGQVARDSEHNNGHQMYNKHTQLNNRWGLSSPRGTKSGCMGWVCFFPPGKYRIWPKMPPRDRIFKQNTDLAGNWEDSGFTLLWDMTERSLGCSGLNTVIIHPIPSVLQKWRKKIHPTFTIYIITVVPYFGRKISSTSISRHTSFTGNSFNLGHWELTSPGVRPTARACCFCRAEKLWWGRLEFKKAAFKMAFCFK